MMCRISVCARFRFGLHFEQTTQTAVWSSTIAMVFIVNGDGIWNTRCGKNAQNCTERTRKRKFENIVEVLGTIKTRDRQQKRHGCACVCLFVLQQNDPARVFLSQQLHAKGWHLTEKFAPHFYHDNRKTWQASRNSSHISLAPT